MWGMGSKGLHTCVSDAITARYVKEAESAQAEDDKYEALIGDPAALAEVEYLGGRSVVTNGDESSVRNTGTHGEMEFLKLVEFDSVSDAGVGDLRHGGEIKDFEESQVGDGVDRASLVGMVRLEDLHVFLAQFRRWPVREQRSEVAKNFRRLASDRGWITTAPGEVIIGCIWVGQA